MLRLRLGRHLCQPPSRSSLGARRVADYFSACESAGVARPARGFLRWALPPVRDPNHRHKKKIHDALSAGELHVDAGRPSEATGNRLEAEHFHRRWTWGDVATRTGALGGCVETGQQAGSQANVNPRLNEPVALGFRAISNYVSCPHSLALRYLGNADVDTGTAGGRSVSQMLGDASHEALDRVAGSMAEILRARRARALEIEEQALAGNADDVAQQDAGVDADDVQDAAAASGDVDAHEDGEQRVVGVGPDEESDVLAAAAAAGDDVSKPDPPATGAGVDVDTDDDMYADAADRSTRTPSASSSVSSPQGAEGGSEADWRRMRAMALGVGGVVKSAPTRRARGTDGNALEDDEPTTDEDDDGLGQQSDFSDTDDVDPDTDGDGTKNAPSSGKRGRDARRGRDDGHHDRHSAAILVYGRRAGTLEAAALGAVSIPRDGPPGRIGTSIDAANGSSVSHDSGSSPNQPAMAAGISKADGDAHHSHHHHHHMQNHELPMDDLTVAERAVSAHIRRIWRRINERRSVQRNGGSGAIGTGGGVGASDGRVVVVKTLTAAAEEELGDGTEGALSLGTVRELASRAKDIRARVRAGEGTGAGRGDRESDGAVVGVKQIELQRGDSSTSSAEAATATTTASDDEDTDGESEGRGAAEIDPLGAEATTTTSIRELARAAFEASVARQATRRGAKQLGPEATRAAAALTASTTSNPDGASPTTSSSSSSSSSQAIADAALSAVSPGANVGGGAGDSNAEGSTDVSTISAAADVGGQSVSSERLDDVSGYIEEYIVRRLRGLAEEGGELTEVIGSEVRFTVPLLGGAVTAVGSIDRLELRAAPDGTERIVVVEVKSSDRRRRAKNVTMQLRFYLWAVERMTGVRPDGEVHVIRGGGRRAAMFTHTDATFAETGAIVTDAARGIISGSFPARATASKCKTCPVRASCTRAASSGDEVPHREMQINEWAAAARVASERSALTESAGVGLGAPSLAPAAKGGSPGTWQRWHTERLHGSSH